MIVTSARTPTFDLWINSNVGEYPSGVEGDTLRESVLGISVSRRLGAAAGTFQITLLPRRTREGTTWTDLLNPMDYVRIELHVPPRQPRVVMRGFIDSVTEQLQMSSGRPQRVVSVIGRDYGKLTLSTKLFYFDTSGQGFPQSLRLLLSFQQGLDRLTSASEFRNGSVDLTEDLLGRVASIAPALQMYSPSQIIQSVYDTMFRPTIDDLLARFAGTQPDFINQVPGGNEDGLVAYNPIFGLNNTWRPYTDVWSLLNAYAHRPWRELFWEEEEGPSGGPRLYYRETPWLDSDGVLIQPTAPFVVTPLTWDEVADYQLARGDEGQVFNLFLTDTPMSSIFTQAGHQFGQDLGAMFAGTTPFRGNPFLSGLVQEITGDRVSDFHRHGLRMFQAQSHYFDYQPSTFTKEEWLSQSDRIRDTLGIEWNTRLRRAYDHGLLLEHGNLVVKGDERLRIGQYVRLDDALYYVEGVSHAFRQGTRPGDGSFRTSLEVTRGRGHIARLEAGRTTP